MNNDFSKPQKQSLVGVVIMFGNTFQKAIRALFPLLLIWAFQIDKLNKLYFAIGAGAVFILIGVIAYLRYLNFTFQLDEQNQEFVIRDGIWNKSRVAIPLDRIQQVNINQSVLQRIIGVHQLEVDTAGSGNQEVSIKAISHDLAIALKERLLEDSYKGRQAVTDEEEAPADRNSRQTPFIQISFLSLFKTGITSNYTRTIGLLIAFLITSMQYIDDVITYSGYEEDTFDKYITPEVLLRFLAFIIVAVMALILLLNLTRTIIRFFGFKITKQQDVLLLSYGLLNTKNTIIRPHKVQIVTVASNYFQKKLNVYDLRIKQAINLEASNNQQKKTAIEIPGCNENERDTLLKFLLGKVPEKGAMLKPNFRKMIFPSFFFIIVPLCIYSGLGYTVAPELLYGILFVPVYVVFVGLLIYFNFRHSRLFTTSEFIIKQSGAWDIGNECFSPDKINTISLTQYFWQRSSNVGIVKLYTAGDTISFGLANYSRLKELVNQWLYLVETSGKKWM
jgi:putative membrane protein